MDDEKFHLLVQIIETMQDEDIKHSKLEATIVEILNKFDNSLNQEQKLKIMKEFLKYAKIRKEMESSKKSQTDEEMYKRQVTDFLKSEEAD